MIALVDFDGKKKKNKEKRKKYLKESENRWLELRMMKRTPNHISFRIDYVL